MLPSQFQLKSYNNSIHQVNHQPPVSFTFSTSTKSTTEDNRPLITATHNSTPESFEYYKKINQAYQQTIQKIFDPINDIYTFAPEISDLKIPLRTSLELIETTDSLFKKAPIKTLKPAQCGLSGKVKFVHFKKDSIPDRWFAIKRPINIFDGIFNRRSTTLTYYENNLNIATKIGNHRNFMKVHGITLKEVKKGAKTKSYLILEYIEGIRLRDIQNLPFEKSLNLLNQLINAITHLFNLKILPVDANYGNFIITKNNDLKLIDFDAWKDIPDNPEYLAEGLYKIACNVANKLADGFEFEPPKFQSFDTNAKQNLENSLKFLTENFSQKSSDSIFFKNNLYSLEDLSSEDLYTWPSDLNENKAIIGNNHDGYSIEEDNLYS